MSIAGKLAKWLIWAALPGLLCGLPPAVAAELRVVVLLSDNSAPYQAFYKTLSRRLPTSIRAVSLESPEELQSVVPQPDLIVTVGMKATESVIAKTNIPQLGAMIPKAAYEGLLAKQKPTGKISAIYLNQPWSRQLDFLHAILPAMRRIGLLYSPDAHIDLARLRQDVAAKRYSLIAQPVRSAETLFSSLDEVLAESDVLLAVPDSMIYSSSNIRNILLTSYRRNVPLIGLSQAYVNAGALGAIFSTPEQLAEQAGDAIVAFAKSTQLPEPQYPVTFTVAVNQQVARSLGGQLRSPEAIQKQMSKEKEEGQ